MTRTDPPTVASDGTAASGVLRSYVEARADESDQIPAARREALDLLAGAIAAQSTAQGDVALTFICTHNSRRSQMAQIWAKIAADLWGVEAVATYSGGTEATAFNPRAVAALERAGLRIQSDGAASNPAYRVTGWGDAPPLVCRSKRFSDDANPAEGFIAVMTCSDADGACPVVPGAGARVAVMYEDPKAFDDTAQEANAYDERCAQIAR